MRDRERACVVRRRREGREPARGRRRSSAAGRSTAAASSRRGASSSGIGRAAAMGNLDDLEPEARRVCLDDLANLRIRRLGEDDLRPAGHVLRDEARIGGDGRAVVARRVRDVHARQLADRGLVLEDRLEHALAHLGLVRRVRGQEFAALEDRVGDRRYVMVIDPGAEERELPRRCRRSARPVPRGGAEELRLGQRRLEVELRPRRTPGRDVAEKLLDRIDADLREHRLAVGVGQREVATGLSTCRAESRRRRVASRLRKGRSDGSAPRPDLAVGILVHGLGLVDDILRSPRAPHRTAARSDPTRPSPTRPRRRTRPSRSSRPLVGRLVVDELAERVLGEPGDAEGPPRRSRCAPSRARCGTCRSSG